MNMVSFRYTLFSAILAFCLWGGWALHVNYALDPIYGLRAGLVQGSMSFIFTILMIHLLAFIYRHSPKKIRSFLPPILTVCCTGTLLYIVHTLVHTPDVLKTIAPPIAVALNFCWFTNSKFSVSESEKNERRYPTTYQD